MPEPLEGPSNNAYVGLPNQSGSSPRASSEDQRSVRQNQLLITSFVAENIKIKTFKLLLYSI
jgi:hypothetical protein